MVLLVINFFLIWWLPKEHFLSWCLVYCGFWGILSSGKISSHSLFWFSVQKKELVVVDVEIEPSAVLTVRIVENKVYLLGSFFCFFVAIQPNIVPTEFTL